MATTDPSSALTGLPPAEQQALIPGATELEQALFDGRLVALHRAHDGSSTWIPAPGTFELADSEAFATTVRTAAERSRLQRGLPAD